uniref:DUF4220 domain-containing protein n=1 Tax=Oryza brachyantha TaxID=4533 RepID=J3KZL5_ORYBR
MSSAEESCVAEIDWDALSLFTEQTSHRLVLRNVVLFLSLVMAAALVGAGSFSRRYWRHGSVRLLFLGAYTIFLPLVSYVVSSGVDKENCKLPNDIDKCSDDGTVHLLVWASMVQMVGANYLTAISVHDDEPRSIGPTLHLLLGAIWTLFLVVQEFRMYTYSNRGYYWLILVPCALSLVKILAKLYAYVKSRRSFEVGVRSCRLIAGYMEQFSLPRDTDEYEIPLIFMGEDKQKTEESPRGYRFTDDGVDITTLVTTNTVANMYDDNVMNMKSGPPFRDLCLSFSLFKLLRQRFTRYAVVQADHRSVPNFMIKLRHGDPRGIGSPLMKRLIHCMLRFRCKSLHDSYKMGQASIMDTNTKIVKAVRRLFQLPDQKFQYVEMKPEVNTAILNKFRESNCCSLPTVTATLQQSPIGNGILRHYERKGTSDVILVWHIATCIFEIKHPLDECTSAHAITASQLSRYCAYLLSSAPELLPDDKAWSKKLYKSVKKITEPIFRSRSNAMPVQYDDILKRLYEKGSDNTELKSGVELGKLLVDKTQGSEQEGWEVLAGFWSAMVLYLAPSDNVGGHREAIARGGELITILWVMLTHAGIITRPRTGNVV